MPCFEPPALGFGNADAVAAATQLLCFMRFGCRVLDVFAGAVAQ